MVITADMILTVCAGISCVGLAIGYLYKAVNYAHKPMEEIHKKVEHLEECADQDNKRIEALEDGVGQTNHAVNLLLKSNLAILGHLQTDNNTGEMARATNEIQEFLIERK